MKLIIAPDEHKMLSAAKNGDLVTVQALAGRGIAVDAPGPRRTTPIMMAAAEGQVESVNFLLARKVKPDGWNDDQECPLSFAVSGGRASS